MSWEDIIKNDMEQYERRMLSREKRGDIDENEFKNEAYNEAVKILSKDISEMRSHSRKLTDELKAAQDNLRSIVDTATDAAMSIKDRPELANKKIENALIEIIKTAKQTDTRFKV